MNGPLVTAAGAGVINLDHPGTYLNWSIFTVSVANLVLIAVMVVIFGAALILPFPRGRTFPPAPEPDPATGEARIPRGGPAAGDAQTSEAEDHHHDRDEHQVGHRDGEDRPVQIRSGLVEINNGGSDVCGRFHQPLLMARRISNSSTMSGTGQSPAEMSVTHCV